MKKCICKLNFSINEDDYFKGGDEFDFDTYEIKTSTFYYLGYKLHTHTYFSNGDEITFSFNEKSFNIYFKII